MYVNKTKKKPTVGNSLRYLGKKIVKTADSVVQSNVARALCKNRRYRGTAKTTINTPFNPFAHSVCRNGRKP